MGASIGQRALSGASATERVFINVFGTATSNIGWNTLAQASQDYFGGEMFSSTTQNDEIVFSFVAEPGTYTLDMFHKQGTSRGIYTISIDGVELGTTVDGYAAATAVARATIANIAIGATAQNRHTIKFKMKTKNATATAYMGMLHGLSLVRTGA